ncbi:alpha/beta fold hydrolase [Tenggerimyces flavus]|uniref:Alpha/beta fold hydrolase n=1 Tax=Tenggerimyces flavus TaxID=1708749 RepID=A0ABV7Y7K4_9ACTN|nr:alpha/beta fold hydrolase [Tenggerimyces flavus]MBM7785048.1 pimeloyl-ACP methyl ester carboxylesterase [Tenggerimyces flavus]
MTTDTSPAETQEAPADPKKRTKRRRWPVVLLAIVAVLSTTGLVAMLAMGGPSLGYFRTPEGRATYVSAYETAMKTMPAPTATRDLTTTFGTVRAYAWVNDKPVDDTPVVLLPGRASGVPMWGTNLPDFAAHRTVYAFDAVGDSGLSEQTLPLRDMDDNARWVDEALAALKLDQVHLVGHSQGGGLAAAVAVRHPERIASLTMLDPIMTLGTIPLWAFGWTALASLPGIPKSWRDHALNKIGGVEDEEVDPNDPMARMIAAGTEHFSSGSLPTPSPLTDAQLKGLPMPVYVALASDKSLAGGGAAEKAELIPDAQVKVWPNTTHSLPMQAGKPLDAELESFWAAHRP